MAIKSGYWTQERLDHLMAEYENPKRKISDKRLAEKLGINYMRMFEVVNFIRQSRDSLESIETINGVPVKRYKPGFAIGATQVSLKTTRIRIGEW